MGSSSEGPHPAGRVARLIAAARRGSTNAQGELLQLCRPYLLRIASADLHASLRAKGGESDLVQETFLKAQRGFAKFQGSSEGELLVWLRRILRNNTANFIRHYRTAKRQASVEVPLQGEASSADLQAALAAEAPSPSDREEAREQALLLERALQRLPDHYRDVIWLRHHEDRSFDEIGQMLDRSPAAVQKLWSRAIRRLKEELEGFP